MKNPLITIFYIIFVSLIAPVAAAEQKEPNVQKQANPAKIRETIKAGDRENAMIMKWKGLALRCAILTWGGTGNHRLILALPNDKQITFEVEGPYLSEWSKIVSIGDIEPVHDWKSMRGIELVDIPNLAKLKQKPAEQDVAPQSATRPASGSKGVNKSQPETKERSE